MSSCKTEKFKILAHLSGKPLQQIDRYDRSHEECECVHGGCDGDTQSTLSQHHAYNLPVCEFARITHEDVSSYHQEHIVETQTDSEIRKYLKCWRSILV